MSFPDENTGAARRQANQGNHTMFTKPGQGAMSLTWREPNFVSGSAPGEIGWDFVRFGNFFMLEQIGRLPGEIIIARPLSLGSYILTHFGILPIIG